MKKQVWVIVLLIVIVCLMANSGNAKDESENPQQSGVAKDFVKEKQAVLVPKDGDGNVQWYFIMKHVRTLAASTAFFLVVGPFQSKDECIMIKRWVEMEGADTSEIWEGNP